MTESVIELWQRCLGTQYPLTDRLFRQNVLNDPFGQSEGNVVALQNGQLVGWALCRVLKGLPPELARYEGRASIGALCVHPNHRRRGIGSLLYTHAEAFVLSQGASTFTVVHYPHHLLVGIPSEAADLKAFLARHGFQEWRDAYDLHRRLTDPTLGAQLTDGMRTLPPQVSIRPAQHGNEGVIIDFVAREFPGGWHYDTQRFFDHGGVPSDLIVVLEDHAMVGFAHTHTPDSVELRGSLHWISQRAKGWGGLGPIGIAATHRRRGIGFALLCAGVQHLRARGVEDLVIDWTDLLNFYGRLGFRIWKRYWQGSKPLESEAARVPSQLPRKP